MKKIILALYSLFLILITVFSYIFIDPHLIYFKQIFTGFAYTQRSAATVIYSLIIISFFAFYLIFLYFFRKKIFSFREFKFIVGVTVLILFFAYPAMVSYDIFNYIATAKVLFLYHENPYLIMPIQFTGDPLLLFTHAANKIALYGPFWILLTGIPYFLGFGNFIITLFSFKLLTAIFYLASVVILYRTSKNVYKTALFALNPLVILEVLVSGHNDIVMMFFALSAFFCIKEKKWFLLLLFILFSVLIKYATLFLLPVFAYAIFNYFRDKKVDWEKVYYLSSLFMLAVFFLSPIREEIYPWYAIWFLIFVPLIQSRFMRYVYLTFSFSLLLRDLPFMLLGTYFGPTPLIKLIVSFTFPFLAVVYLSLRRNKFIGNKK